jgi:capsular exopolysaccharide synthesis family protein
MIPGEKKRKADFTDVVMYVAIATKHARTIVLLFTLALTAGLIFYIFSRPVYSSKSLIQFTAIGSITPDDKTVENERFDKNRWLRDFYADHIVSRTEAALGNVSTAGAPRRSLMKQVRATWTTDENIELNVFAYSPEWVLTFPSNMVNEYLRFEREKLTNTHVAELAKLDAQLIDLTARLAAQEANKARVLGQYDADQLAGRLNELRTVPFEIERLRSQIQEYNTNRAKLLNPGLSDSERLSLLSSFDSFVLQAGSFVEIDPGMKASLSPGARPANGTVIVSPSLQRANAGSWEQIEQEKRVLDRAIQEQLLIYRPTHIKVQKLLQQRDALEKRLKEALAQALARFEIIGLNLDKSYRRLEALYPQYRLSQEKYNEYLSQKTLMDKGDTDYASMIAAINRRKAERYLALNNPRVQLRFEGIDSSRHEIPIAPHRGKIVLMSLGIGLALAIGIPFLLEFMDQTVTNMEKMEEAVNLRGLGIVPDFEDDVAEAYPLIFSDGVANPDFIENFRVIRTNLLSSAATTKFPQVIMVSSTSPKEGKTVVASNLAMSFAHMGEKTLILDANLRRGIEHHLFGSRATPGLSNVLVEKHDVYDACRPTSMENLHILPCGDNLEGDIEALGSQQFVATIEKLRKRYQRIIVDATPVLGLAETSVMQPAMDGIVLVIWSGQTPTRAVRTAIDILHDNHANFYGFVLNRLDLMATMNRFHYYYYTNHYYNRYQSLTRTPGQSYEQSR